MRRGQKLKKACLRFEKLKPDDLFPLKRIVGKGWLYRHKTTEDYWILTYECDLYKDSDKNEIIKRYGG